RNTARPSSPGIRRSSRRTCGRCWRTAASVASPFVQVATTARSASSASNDSSPFSTMAWSSAITTRIFVSGKRHYDVEPCAGVARCDREGALECLHPFGQHLGTDAELTPLRIVVPAGKREAAPVAVHRDQQPARRAPYGDVNGRGAGVTRGVDDGFAHNQSDL